MHCMNKGPMLKPTLADLRAFVTVGELQSFAAAAKALHLSQPALSRRISHLEALLGVRLFDRTTRSVALTLLGRRFLGEVSGLVVDIDRSVLSLRDAAELETGDVTIGCVFSAVHHFLPPVIQAFREMHPRVLVRLIEEGADEVLDCVKHGEADLAVTSACRIPTSSSRRCSKSPTRWPARPATRSPGGARCDGKSSRSTRSRGSRTHRATGSSSTRRSPSCRRCRGRSSRFATCRR